MLRRNSQRLCKFAACLAVLAVICYAFGKCDDFVPVLFKKLDGFTDQFNKLLPQLNSMLKSRLNYTALASRQQGNKYDLKPEDGSYLRGNDEKPAQITNDRDVYVKVQNPDKDNTQSKQELKDSENNFLRESDFIKVFAKFTERQNVEAGRRQSQFENLLKNLTRILVDIHQKGQEDSFGIVGNKNERGQNERSGELTIKKPNYFDANEPLTLKRRPFTSQTHTKQPQITSREELTVRNDKSAEILPKTDLFEPSSTSTLKVNYPTSKTEKLVKLREKSITTRSSYNALTTEANLSWTKTNNKRQITTAMKNLTTFKPAKLLLDQNTLNRRAEIFLRKMKNFGLTYNESIFYYKIQPNSGIFYREVSPVTAVRNKLTIFLLHDSHYDSQVWLSIGTLYSLATHGYRVIALDLPGHGKSKNVSEPPNSIEKLKSLVTFMLAVTPKSPRVIVSPGESGLYSVPMVMSASVMLKGVVFISTAYTGKYPASRYENVQLPVLVVYGGNDDMTLLGEFIESMNRLPNSGRFRSIQNAGHDCYMEQPDVFHELMTDFLLKVSQRDKTQKHVRAQKHR
jgi:hypothetical protein